MCKNSGILTALYVFFGASVDPQLQSEGDSREWWGLWHSGYLKPHLIVAM